LTALRFNAPLLWLRAHVDSEHLLQVGCQVRFTLLVRMCEDLQPYCEVMSFVAEHTGHVGANALPHHRRQQWLSAAAGEFVAQGLSFKLSTEEILARNVQRIEREWLTVPSNAASGVVRLRQP